jgi:hypothetical protein
LKPAIFLLITILLAGGAVPSFAASSLAAAPPPVYFNETIFEARDGKMIAPRAKHAPLTGRYAEGIVKGWTPENDKDYISYDAGEIIDKGQGTIKIEMVVLGDGDAVLLAPDHVDALVTFYDDSGKAFFAIGLNDHDLVVGSFPLHPMLMEDAFGGVGFPYLSKLGGPLKGGTEMSIYVTWGPKPEDDKVYLNGKYMDLDSRRGPKSGGNTPGYPQTATLGSFLDGFEGSTGGRVGPLKTLVIGRTDSDNSPITMHPPRSVAIKSVTVSNKIEAP